MPPPTPPLVTAAELRAIARRAVDALNASADVPVLDQDVSKELARRSHAWFLASMEALRFCAQAAHIVRDPALLPLLAEGIGVARHMKDRARDDAQVIAQGVTTLLDAGAPITEEVHALARHTVSNVREAVALGLLRRSKLGAGAGAEALLQALAADPAPDVRAWATAALKGAVAPPWWAGKLPEDPAAHVPADALQACAPALERLSALLDRPSYEQARSEGEIVALARTLPDPLPVQLAESALSVTYSWGLARMPALGALMLDRPGGVQALARLCARWAEAQGFGSLQAPRVIQEMISLLPAARQAAVCAELAAMALGAPRDARNQYGGPAQILARAAVESWPPAADLTALLDALLAQEAEPREGSDTDWVTFHVIDVFRRESANPRPILKRVVEARLAGYPGPWGRLGSALDGLLDRANRRSLRAAAKRALRSEDERTRVWGLERLTGPLHDPRTDGEPAETVRRFLEDSRLRSAILASSTLIQRALPLLRAELRAGRLEAHDARMVLRAVHALYGGLAGDHFLAYGANAEEKRRSLREALRPFLGPPELDGPPTDAEWDACRAARDRDPRRDYPHYLGALLTLPEGPWDPRDRALLERAAEDARRHDEGIALPLSTALAAKPDPRDLALMDELCALFDDSHVRANRRRMRAQLGLRDGATGEATPNATAQDWMDEPE